MSIFPDRIAVSVATRSCVGPVLVLVLVLCGCGADADEGVSPPPLHTASTSPLPPAPEAATPATPWGQSSSSLTVLAIGDSFVAWSSWPELYADAAASALDRPIALDTSLSRAGAGPRLPAISSDEEAQSRIRDADIVVIQPEPGFAAEPMNAYLAGTCGGPANTACFGTGAEDYRSYVTEYLDLVTSLTTPDTALRIVTTGTWVIDALHPNLRADEPAKLHALIDLVDELMAVVESEAEARSIPVVDVNTAFTGPDHRRPAPDGYLISDGMHLDDSGSAVVARLLTDTGFAPLDGS